MNTFSTKLPFGRVKDAIFMLKFSAIKKITLSVPGQLIIVGAW
jgi:hypothetical protein